MCLIPRIFYPKKTHRATGFSLVEINIALFVLGVGLVSLLGLYPVGLRQSNLSYSDTLQTMFADHVLNRIQANADRIETWSDFRASKLIEGVNVGGASITLNSTNTIRNYLGMPGQDLTYFLQIQSVTRPIDFRGYLLRASIRSSDRDKTLVDIAQNPVFCRDFVFMGKVR